MRELQSSGRGAAWSELTCIPQLHLQKRQPTEGALSLAKALKEALLNVETYSGWTLSCSICTMGFFAPPRVC